VDKQKTARAERACEGRGRRLVVRDLLEALESEHDVVAAVGDRAGDVDRLEAHVPDSVPVSVATPSIERLLAQIGRYDGRVRIPLRYSQREEAVSGTRVEDA
jgi:hypothetical protein